MTKMKTRIAALEQRAEVPNATPAPFWSDEHKCLMQNRGGFILPVPLAIDEWETVAEAQQRQLTT